ncbi:MAG: methanogenesis marker 16 metalloprotein [archaeon]|nr:methanogenesis marker 16 metalloprotein [archaeon]
MSDMQHGSGGENIGRTVSEIQKKIVERKAKVYTAQEIKDLVRSGKKPAVEDVDVVTCGTFGVVSGTFAIFSIPVCGPNEFKHAVEVTLNGVPATVGPCPNESLGIIDIMVNGTSKRDSKYGGGHLFRDLVSGKPVEIVVKADNGKTVKAVKTLSEIPFAKMVTTRSFFKNYSCFATAEDPVSTIFCGPRPMEGKWAEATVSGCGDINPVQNDPDLRFLKQGAGVFVNGAPGIVIGTGTRSSPAKPNLSVEADMHLMVPEFMGGFQTSVSPECTISVGAAIPVLDQRMLDGLSVLNEDIDLGIGDVRDRIPVYKDTYASVWSGSNDKVTEDHGRCLKCRFCRVDATCPRAAHPFEGIDRDLCMDCGMCVDTCIGKVFQCDMGTVRISDKDVPIRQRQSSRTIGLKVCETIKQLVEEGKWSMGYYNEWI